MKEITAAVVNALTVAQIKTELSTKGLSTKGKKDDLAARLLEAEGLGSMNLPGEASSSEICNTQNDDEAIDIIVAQMEKEAAKDSNQGALSYKLNHGYSKPTSKSDGRGETLQKNVPAPNSLSVSKVDKELRPLCSALESLAKSLESTNQLLHQERAYSKGLLQENQDLKLKLKTVEEKTLGLLIRSPTIPGKMPVLTPLKIRKMKRPETMPTNGKLHVTGEQIHQWNKSPGQTAQTEM